MHVMICMTKHCNVFVICENIAHELVMTID